MDTLDFSPIEHHITLTDTSVFSVRYDPSVDTLLLGDSVLLENFIGLSINHNSVSFNQYKDMMFGYVYVVALQHTLNHLDSLKIVGELRSSQFFTQCDWRRGMYVIFGGEDE